MADDDNSSDDDLYGEVTTDLKKPKKDDDSSGNEPMDEGTDSGDEDDSEDSESDIDIIIDKPVTAPKSAIQSQSQESKAIKIEDPSRQQTSTPAQASRTIPLGTAPHLSGPAGTAYPAQRTSTIDVDGNPVYPPVDKEILRVEIDADLAEEQKIWRKPGEDQSDYFNYGFDEFTWELYRNKQSSMANVLQQQKNDIAHMQQMMGGPMPGMPGMAGNGGGGGGAPGGNNAPVGAPSGPGGGGGGGAPPGAPSEEQMQMMMQQMMQSGMDPSQMDFNTFMQMMGQGMPFPGGPGGGQPGGGGFAGNQGGGGGGRGGRGRGRGGW